jgi:hypothetical protein
LISTEGVDHIGAPDGPRSFMPVELTLPVYFASSIVCAVHSFWPLLASSATTAPCPSQHSCFGSAPRPTPEEEIGTMMRSPTSTGAPVIPPNAS